MRTFQNLLRALILAGSVFGFLGSWALFAHSGKPARAAGDPLSPPDSGSLVPAPTPLPPLNFPQSGATSRARIQPLPQIPQFSAPRLRTRGS